MKRLVLICLLIASLNELSAQKNLIYVDKNGSLRYTATNKEAFFFGVNYTTPFAFGYRSHKQLNVDLHEAIDRDVYHLARLGIDAFRVHMWDVEISDIKGNLLDNEHLQLFDYLLMKLKERKIKILITPIAFWGNGYPEKDEKTPGFSTFYGKDKAVVNEEAIIAQENYLEQIANHVNNYTKLAYKDDPDIIAAEINNEPHHSGPKETTTEYVNRLTNALQKAGWTKPIFYNISESPFYAGAVANAAVAGHSFQWYPTGLVSGHEIKGNNLPSVDQYLNPFIDSLPAVRTRAKIVYEFDAGDVMTPVMYPAMARSFRKAGFQWATQFAYDPYATAFANPEYQTHYLNLAYTPSKAISLLIASKIFHNATINQLQQSYPADTAFGDFVISPSSFTSVMNSNEDFYFTGSTNIHPKEPSKLEHIAGVGNTAVTKYEGSGAYFIDKVKPATFRLEIYPDAIVVNDPFEKASLAKPVTILEATEHSLILSLPSLGKSYFVKGINKGNFFNSQASNGEIRLMPGTYLISESDAGFDPVDNGIIRLAEYNAPTPVVARTYCYHRPVIQASADRDLLIHANINNIMPEDKISLECRANNQWKTIGMTAADAGYEATIPATLMTPGEINYRIIIQKTSGDFHVFPGDHLGDPYAWDAYNKETWKVQVAQPHSAIALFMPAYNRDALNIYNRNWRDNVVTYVSGDRLGSSIQQITAKSATEMGWQLFLGDFIKGRAGELADANELVIKCNASVAGSASIKLGLITKTANYYAVTATPASKMTEMRFRLNDLKEDSMLLLPRPYPGFQPLKFRSTVSGFLKANEIEKLQIIITTTGGAPVTVGIEGVWLE